MADVTETKETLLHTAVDSLQFLLEKMDSTHLG